MNQENQETKTTEQMFNELVVSIDNCLTDLKSKLSNIDNPAHRYEFEVTLNLLTKELDYYKMIPLFNGEIDEAFILGSTYEDGKIMRRFDDLLNRLLFIADNWSLCEIKEDTYRIYEKLCDCQHYFWSLFGILLYNGAF